MSSDSQTASVVARPAAAASETEGEGQERDDGCGRHEAGPYAQRGGLPLQLGHCELNLELDERARVIGHTLGGAGKSVHSLLLTTRKGP